MSDITELKDFTSEQTPRLKISVDLIGSRIRQLREVRRKSIEEVAAGAGLTPAALTHPWRKA